MEEANTSKPRWGGRIADQKTPRSPFIFDNIKLWFLLTMIDAFGEEPATVNGDMFQVSLHMADRLYSI